MIMMIDIKVMMTIMIMMVMTICRITIAIAIMNTVAMTSCDNFLLLEGGKYFMVNSPVNALRNSRPTQARKSGGWNRILYYCQNLIYGNSAVTTYTTEYIYKLIYILINVSLTKHVILYNTYTIRSLCVHLRIQRR